MRKNDQERKGHHMRFGVSADPDLDLPFQLCLFMDLTCTHPSTNWKLSAMAGEENAALSAHQCSPNWSKPRMEAGP